MRYLFICLTILFTSCQTQPKPEETVLAKHSTFGDHWYRGLAEITSYELKQARYSEIRRGTATLIFVTEDFSNTKQVKLDRVEDANDAVSVIKLNKVKKFDTGIYPYSMMTSVFSPIDASPHALKTSTTVQEWCGHTFLQSNRRDGEIHLKGYSYFESEGDQSLSTEPVWLEDELWNIIRMNPNGLPLGELEIIPSSFYLRLKHQPIQSQNAIATIDSTIDQITYQLEYPELSRSLAITFAPEAPYPIISWEERYPDGSGIMTTEAKQMERVWLSYWELNATSDTLARQQLRLP